MGSIRSCVSIRCQTDEVILPATPHKSAPKVDGAELTKLSGKIDAVMLMLETVLEKLNSGLFDANLVDAGSQDVTHRRLIPESLMSLHSKLSLQEAGLQHVSEKIDVLLSRSDCSSHSEDIDIVSKLYEFPKFYQINSAYGHSCRGFSLFSRSIQWLFL